MPQLLVEQCQDVVLETALLFCVQLELPPFLGPHAGMDEELKWASRKLFHAADGSAQHRSVKPRGQVRRKLLLQFGVWNCRKRSRTEAMAGREVRRVRGAVISEQSSVISEE